MLDFDFYNPTHIIFGADRLESIEINRFNMKKIKIQNQPFGPFPTIIIGSDVNGKPNYVTVGACGVVSMKPVLYVSLKSSHYTTPGV